MDKQAGGGVEEGPVCEATQVRGLDSRGSKE